MSVRCKPYYYRGCVYRDMRCMDLAVKDFLQALKVIPKRERVSLFGGHLRESGGMLCGTKSL